MTDKEADLRVDIAIIGAGTAGMAAYREVVKVSSSVALIEGGVYGTTCARVGCMPSKLLIAPAEAVHRLHRFQEFGLEVGDPRIDGRAVMARVRRERDRFVGFVKDAVEGFEPKHQIKACARFIDDHHLALDDGRTLRAERIIIATGSRPVVPPMLEPAGDRLVTNDDVFDWEDLPKSVAVFGPGVIGLELGQALHRLGVRVRLFGKGGSVGPLSDPDVRNYARTTFEAEFPFLADPETVELTRDGDAVRIDFEDKEGNKGSEQFDYVLAAVGRRTNTDQLSLDKTSLELDQRGVPVYDPLSMQTSLDHVFIAGDAVVDLPLLHEAADEGRLAGENAGRFPEVYKRARRTPLGIVFSDPQIAIVGQSYRQLEQSGTEFAVGEVSFEDQGRARVMLVNKGLLRVYGEEGTGLLLGAEMIGPEVEHLAHLVSWAIESRLTVQETILRPFYHPVVEEGLRTALRTLSNNLGMGPNPPLRCIDCGPGG